MTPREGALLGLSAGGFHRLSYLEWGDPAAERTVVCVHGLTRNGRDFDCLAEVLAEAGWRVVCPDIVGRGRSGWLADPAGYGYPQYLADMAALIARLGVERVDWVGTSMGGLIGMLLAAQPQSPIARLAINDVGPFIPKAALERIATYLGKAPVFPDLAALEAYLREILAPFGALTDAQWAHLARHSARRVEGGADEGGPGGTKGGSGFALAYDPAIRVAFEAQPLEDVDLWQVWERIACPVLALRGAESDLLLPATAAEMAKRGPRAEVVEIAGCGHAPALMNEAQTGLLRDWLGVG